MGTMIQRYRLGEADFRGTRFARTSARPARQQRAPAAHRPAHYREIHEQYLAAGADIISTNTFGGTRTAQEDYGLAEFAYEMNLEAAKLARAAADRFSSAAKPRFVAGAMGPTPKTASISPDVNDPGARNITFDDLVLAYGEQARGLLDGGADILLIETIFDTLNAKAAIFAVEQEFERRGARWPVVISGTVTDASGRILSGQTVEAFWHSVRHAKPLAVGLNCALGAALMRPYIEELATIADTFVSVYPNAGLPNPMSETRLRRDAGSHLGPAGRVRTGRLRQHRRRLLRHHARTHRGDRHGDRRHRAAAGASRGAAAEAVGPGGRDHRRRGVVRQRRRADQRHRFEGLRPPRPERPVRGSGRGGAPAGGKRRPGHRCEHGRGDARLGRGDDPFPQPDRRRAGHRARR